MFILVSITNKIMEFLNASGVYEVCKPLDYYDNQVELKFKGLIADKLASSKSGKAGYFLGSAMKSFGVSTSNSKLKIISDDEKYYIKSITVKNSTKPVRFREWTNPEDTSVQFTYVSLWTADARDSVSSQVECEVSL